MSDTRVCSCGGTTFYTTAIESHTWLVDGDGEFIEDRGCDQLYAGPNDDNIWTCATCGKDFN